MALAEAQLGNWEKAQVHLVKALDYKTEIKLNMIDSALQSTLVSSMLSLTEIQNKSLGTWHILFSFRVDNI